VKKTDMSRGYSVSVVENIKKADGELLGVRLGLACVYHGVSVSKVADDLGVTRQTVYHWFCGASSPQEQVRSAIEAYLANLG
jgi:transcriptional regulator with XRE-family HTH domain